MESKNTALSSIKLSKPAQRALAGAGISSLKHFTKITERELASLHGVGPNAVSAIQQALADHGISFKKEKA